MALEDLIIGAESGGNPNARNPYSSATGLGQFTDSTWLSTVRAHRPDLFQRHDPQQILAMRTNPELSREMVGHLARDNADYLRRQGIEPSPGNIYLAHFAGPKGAASILGASDSAPASSIMSPEAMRANPFLANMTVADLKAWASKKVGGEAPSTAIPGTRVASGASGSGSIGSQAAETAAGSQQAQAGGAAGAMPMDAILKIIESQSQPLEPVKTDFMQTPPRIARARALARAMALRSITGA